MLRLPNFLTVATPHDKIFKSLEDIEDKQLANWLRSEITFIIAERDEIKRQFDELKVILRET